MTEEKPIFKKEKLEVVDWLIEHFPNAFFKKSQQVKPFELGIFDTLLEFYERLETPPFSKKLLREAFTYYSNSPGYLSSQKKGNARIDLYGNETDVVTEDQAHYAYNRFQQRYGKKASS